jgi:hypothetical protein
MGSVVFGGGVFAPGFDGAVGFAGGAFATVGFGRSPSRSAARRRTS